jgi:UDP-N-acetylmuramate--L-alanine ligase/UDP-N-acetylenolpyruvoylglucosamine reductase
MSAIARLCLEMGRSVSGSDLESNNLTDMLRSLGGDISEGHRSSNVPEDTGVVVYSSSISENNPELKEARKRNVQIAHRAQMLARLFNKKTGIAVTGTHGKTTTTSLISVMLKNLDLDPTVVIGGEVEEFRGNAALGRGKYFVAEADESDSSFLYFKPFFSVITNVEAEHLDHYRDIAHIKKSFRAFVSNTKDGGTVFYNIDDPVTREIMKTFRGRSSSFGMSEDADIYPSDIKMSGFKTRFKCTYKGKALGIAEISIPGRHNVSNALAAISVGLKTGYKFGAIRKAIKDFGGAKRRFQLRASIGGIMLIDDYAHHPTEIRAVLDACRNWIDKRLVVVFQPHRYTRTKLLADDFGRSFGQADKLILTDIYAASEKPMRNVSIKTIYDKVVANGPADVEIVDKDRIPEHVAGIARPGDMIVMMGAGDIKKTIDKTCAKLNEKFSDYGNYADRLEKIVKGKVTAKEPLRRHTSFKIGGEADVWVEPCDIGDLKKVVAFAEKEKIPFFIIGNGSNILASDGGFRGIVINLASEYFRKIKIDRRNISVGAGYSLPKLVRLACEKGLGGLESMVGIPGTIGGAVYMNAGGWTNPVYKNIGDLVVSIKVMDHKGVIKTLGKDRIGFGYRFSDLDGYIILETRLKLDRSDSGTLIPSSLQFLKMKKDKQVLDMPSAGCVFKNPPNFQFTCGQMIDMLGLKGKRIGGAEISPKHANFIVNRGTAKCEDVVEMISFIKDKVKENYGVTLNLEIKLI